MVGELVDKADSGFGAVPVDLSCESVLVGAKIKRNVQGWIQYTTGTGGKREKAVVKTERNVAGLLLSEAMEHELAGIFRLQGNL